MLCASPGDLFLCSVSPLLQSFALHMSFTSRILSGQACHQMVDAARGVLNLLLPDVHIFIDASQKQERSAGLLHLASSTGNPPANESECALEQVHPLVMELRLWLRRLLGT